MSSARSNIHIKVIGYCLKSIVYGLFVSVVVPVFFVIIFKALIIKISIFDLYNVLQLSIKKSSQLKVGGSS